MRLLRVDNQQFDEVPSHGPFPEYAILSHTWIQPSREEVSYQDLVSQNLENTKAKAGWKKIHHTIEQARKDGFSYVWVDTCCINKLDPTELTEAINCMYGWYAESACCYVYLSDIDSNESRPDVQLGTSQWFTRGWTLQELIAPKFVKIYDRNWLPITTREQSAEAISAITRVHTSLLRDSSNIELYSIANRMSWAAGRRTTRAEDRAYSLLGIFGIVMPLHYGEGEEHAFKRLQQEIIRQTADQSILAWEWPATMAMQAAADSIQKQAPFLAPSPDCFKTRGHVIPARKRINVAYSISNVGLEIETYLVRYQSLPSPDIQYFSRRQPGLSELRGHYRLERVKPLQYYGTSFVGAILDCSSALDPSTVYMLPLELTAGNCYRLDGPMDCLEMDWFEVQTQMEPLSSKKEWQKITILRNPSQHGKESVFEGMGRPNACAKVRISLLKAPSLRFTPAGFSPLALWCKATLAFMPTTSETEGSITLRITRDDDDGWIPVQLSIAFDSGAQSLGLITPFQLSEAPIDLEYLRSEPKDTYGDRIKERAVSIDVSSTERLRILVALEVVDTPCDNYSLVKVVPEWRKIGVTGGNDGGGASIARSRGSTSSVLPIGLLEES